MIVSWIPLASVLATVIIAAFTYRAQRLTSSDATRVQERTVSLDEMEAALTFTGTQLADLRTETRTLRSEVRAQSDEIRELQDQYRECERARVRLTAEMAVLRERGAP